jgi:hypothetical protein
MRLLFGAVSGGVSVGNQVRWQANLTFTVSPVFFGAVVAFEAWWLVLGPVSGRFVFTSRSNSAICPSTLVFLDYQEEEAPFLSAHPAIAFHLQHAFAKLKCAFGQSGFNSAACWNKRIACS